MLKMFINQCKIIDVGDRVHVMDPSLFVKLKKRDGVCSTSYTKENLRFKQNFP